MKDSIAVALVFFALLEGVAPVAAREGLEDHGRALVQLGATAEADLTEHAARVGPTLGFEFETVDDWLEIEVGASPTRSRGATSWELDLQLQKPLQLFTAVEIEPGLGPVWSHGGTSDERPSNWGAEASIDFIFWRSKRFGWFLEPSYGVSFANGTKTSIALSGGIVFGLP